jgi:hypothetical protein
MHHFRTYAAGASLAFRGSVNPIPSARWKVKLKIKVCARGQFQDFTKFDVSTNKHRSTFKGTFAAPPAGLYYVRADLYVNGAVTAESDKTHFSTH